MMLTDHELDLLTEIKSDFWREFSALCNKHIRRAPEHLRDHAEMMLGESTSIYGRDTKAEEDRA